MWQINIRNRRQGVVTLWIVVLLAACTPLIQPVALEENPAVLEARQRLAQQLHVELVEVEIGDVTAKQWPNACLGAPYANERCAQVQTPGYRIPLTLHGQPYLYHTNQDGSELRLVEAPSPTIGERILTWKMIDESGCQTLEAGTDGVAFGVCGGPLLGVPYSLDTRQPDLIWFAGQYQSFTAATFVGTLDFVGTGANVATTAEQRMIGEWARLVYVEAQEGRSGAGWGLVFAWHREGGIAGFCDDVTVYVTGDAYVTSCQANQPEELGRIRLDANQLATIYAWVDTFQSFEVEPTDPATADGMIMRLIFAGTGTLVANAAEQQAVAAFAQQLYEQVVPPAALIPDAVPTELTYTSIEGGFTIRYPVTVTQHSNVRPSVDGIWVQAPQTETFVGMAPNYVLSITWFELADRTVLRSFTDAHRVCSAGPATDGQPFDVAGHAALIFPDTPCGPFATTTYIFTLFAQRGYRMTVETMATYADVQEAVEAIVATLQFQLPPFAVTAITNPIFVAKDLRQKYD